MLHIAVKSRSLLPWLAAFVALLLALPAWAQTTGSLRVLVEDNDGYEIPSVTLRLSGEGMIGGMQERVTDENGTFLFVELLPGTQYRLEATKEGFQGVTVEQIAINISRETKLVVEMRPGSAAEEVVVEATQKAVDTSSTSRGTVLTKEFLNNVPAGRSYQQAVQMAPGVTGGGNPNMGGAASNENTYMLDGANITDPVTGTFSANFNFDAIQQIEVLLGGYMPEYGVSVGGVINVVTESGTNNLQFNANAFYTNGNIRPRRDPRLAADGVQILPTDFDSNIQQLQVNSKVSGPLIRDKAWFVISSSADLSWFRAFGTPQTQSYNGNYLLAKLTFQPSTEHRISTFFQTNPTTIDNLVQGTPYIRDEGQGRQAQGGFINQLRWQWFLSPTVNVDTQLLMQKIFIEQNAVPCTHNSDFDWHGCRPDELEGNVDWETPGRVGISGAYDSVNWGSWYFDDRFRYTASSKMSILSVRDPLGGNHDFKFGVEASQMVWDSASGNAGNLLYVDINEVPFNPQTLANYYWLETTGALVFRTTSAQFNVFAQDSWKPVSNLTVNYGSRFDSFVMRDDVGTPTISGALFGPRLFAAWDPFKDQKTKIATGYGRFNDTGRLEVASFTSQGALGSKLYFGELLAGENGQGFLNSSELLFDYSTPRNLSVAHDKLRAPRVDEVLLTLEREVLRDFAIVSTASGKFTRNSYEYDETSLIYDQDGSAIIGSRNADAFNPYLRLRTPLLAKRDYFQWDVGFRKVLAKRWQAEGTYVFVQSVGSSTSSLSGSFAIDPQTQYNYGLMQTSTSQLKALAFWELPTDPWTQTLGLFFNYQQGFPWERRYWSEASFGGQGGYNLRIQPRGSYLRFGSSWDLGLRFQQEIDVRKGKLVVDVSAFNVTANQAPSSFFLFNLYQGSRFVVPARQSPMSFQTGIRYEF
jgi:hypothetical protein